MAYSKGQLEAIWTAANPGLGDPHLMAAIALAESSGNPSALNSIGACGLWQIHPYEAGCLNPMLNARMAGEKLRSQGLGAWETYTNGSYKQYYTGIANTNREDIGLLEDIAPGLGGPVERLFEGDLTSPSESAEELNKNPFGANPEVGGTGGVISGLANADKLLGLLLSKSGWIRIGKVLVGLFLLLTGVTGMANTSNPNLPEKSSLETAYKVGKAKSIGEGAALAWAA